MKPPIPKLTPLLEKRFWCRMDQPEPDECWEWFWEADSHGYGRVTYGGHTYLAHRVAYFLATGRQPDRLCVCHTCDNPACCNPRHLFVGTPADNTLDKMSKDRQSRLPGESNPSAKLTEKQVIRILKSSLSSAALARKYNVHPSTIGDIRHGRKWKHITRATHEEIVFGQ